MRALSLILGAVVLLCASSAHGDVTLLVGEPFGNFGTMMPSGHAAIYLDHVCADGPLKVRACQPGEREGVVLARYHSLGDTDWIATPAMQFFYAVDREQDVPDFAGKAQVEALREAYRHNDLSALVPDGHARDKATDEWVETAGAAYDRRWWGYRLETAPGDDARLISALNTGANHHHYHLHGANCADFAAGILNFYFPGAIAHADRVADFGVMSPKQVARSVQTYGQTHPQTHLEVVEVAQVPGELRRSRPVRGGAEACLKTKRYLFTLLAIQPEVPLGLLALYLKHGRWQPGRGAEIVSPRVFEGVMESSTATR